MKRQPKKAAAPIEKKKFRGVNDLMDDMELEIQMIKDGTLSEARARVVAKNRQMQIQAVELILQAARLEAKFRPALGDRIGISLTPDKLIGPVLTQ